MRVVTFGSPAKMDGATFAAWVLNALREVERASYIPDQAESMVLIGTIASTSGTTQTLAIPAEYRRLYIEMDGVSFTAAGTLEIAVSADNGATFGTVRSISVATAVAGDTISGIVHVMNLQTTVLGCVARPITFVDGDVADRFQQTQPLAGNASAFGPYNAIQFSGGTFDAGEIRVFGIK